MLLPRKATTMVLAYSRFLKPERSQRPALFWRIRRPEGGREGGREEGGRKGGREAGREGGRNGWMNG